MLTDDRTSAPPAEQRMLLHGVSWKEYVIMRELLDGPSPRMTYLNGALELMSPAPVHELWKKNIARLIELYAHLLRIDLYGYGSATFKHEARQRGAEPDECYLIGKKLDEFPEIVLEVINTSPLLNKLEVYSAMGVAEVWIFQKWGVQDLPAGPRHGCIRRSGPEARCFRSSTSTALPGTPCVPTRPKH